MGESKYEVFEVDVKEILYLLFRRLWIIIAAGILSSVCAWSVSKYLIPPRYTSTTKIYVINRQDERKTTYTDLQTGSQLTKDYMFMVTSRPVLEGVIENLDFNMSPAELAGLISVRNPEGTRILEISVEYTDPYKAKQLADMVAQISSERLVSIMEMEKVSIIEDGNLPTSASSPNIKRNTVLGAFAGILAAGMIIIIVYLLNDNIKSAEDIEKYLGITTLGVIPKDDAFEGKREQVPKRIFHKEEWAS